MAGVILDTSNVHQYVNEGWDHKDWYATESRLLLELLPEFKGLPILRTFAITSMTSSIESNVHLAIKALLQMKRDEPIIGFLPTQRVYLERVRRGMDVPGRKIMSFIQALEGRADAVVVDIWMCKAFGLLKTREVPVNGRQRTYYAAPTRRQYDAIEAYVIDKAFQIGIEPRQLQPIIWSAVKREFGLTNNVMWSELLIKKRGMFGYEM